MQCGCGALTQPGYDVSGSHPSVLGGGGTLQGPGTFWKQGQFQRGGSLCGLRTSLRTREGRWGLKRWGLGPPSPPAPPLWL